MANPSDFLTVYIVATPRHGGAKEIAGPYHVTRREAKRIAAERFPSSNYFKPTITTKEPKRETVPQPGPFSKYLRNRTGVGPGSWVHTPGRSEVYRVIEMQGGPRSRHYLLEGPYPSKARVWTRTGNVYLAADPCAISNPSQGQQASELYEKFHGRPGQFVDEYDEPTPRMGTLTELGDLLELRTKTDAGWKFRAIDFTGQGVKVAANAKGTQLYFVGGNQRIGALAPFGADRSKDLIDLGECTYIAYRTRKTQVNNIPSSYEHFLGEETGRYPRLMYDRRGREPRMYFAGGEYHVAAEGIIN